MKRLFIILLTALLLPLAVQAQYTYTTNSGAITITGYSGPGGTVTIPDIINGYPVTGIADNAFWYNNNLTNLIFGLNLLNLGRNSFAFSTNLASVIIPNSVTNVGGGSFQNCTNLTSITLGDGVRSIGDSAFAFDASLIGLYFQGNAPTFVALTSVFYAVHGATIYYNAGTTGWAASYDALSTATIQSQFGYSINTGGLSVTLTNYTGLNGTVAIPAAIISLPVTTIGYQALYNDSSAVSPGSVLIPNSVTNIANYAFVNCIDLTNADIPNSIISLGSESFAATGLKSVFIPTNVISIGIAPFDYCARLSDISVAPQNPAYSSMGGVLFNKNQTALIEYPGGLAGAYAIPGSVTSIADDAFFYCPNLTGVTILSSVTNLGSAVFADCVNLAAITVDPQNMFFSSVNGVLFNKNQTTLITCPGGFFGVYDIPGSVTRIGEFAFADTYSLTGITIPNSVTTIGADAFYYAVSLTSITIPSSVSSIGDQAFIYSFSLTNLLFRGNAPALSGQYAFYSLGASPKVYYLAGTTGWAASYGGSFNAPVDVANGILPTVELYVPTLRSVSVAGGFGFAISGVTNETVVVEASTNLMNWQAIQTNSTPPFQFTDSHWTSYPNRFYRVLYAP